ncbi:MAG: hypothetical protein RMA76_16795 [Deltaproteobacteria bacterium]
MFLDAHLANRNDEVLGSAVGKRENVFDQAGEVGGRVLERDAEVFARDGVRFIEHAAHRAYDSIEWSPELMAHDREETTLHLQGALHLLVGDLEATVLCVELFLLTVELLERRLACEQRSEGATDARR